VSRRANTSNKRLERRAERQAKQPCAAPRASRQRPNRAGSRTRTKAPAQSRFNPLMIAAIIGGIAILGLLAYAILGQSSSGSSDSLASWQRAEQDSSTTLPGQYIETHPGFDGRYGTADDRQHFANGLVQPICTQDQIDANEISNPLCYTSNPPTSGPHAQSPMQFRVLENPAPKENLIHNMEHGGIVIWYNTTDADAIKLLSDITNDSLDRRRLVVMSSYSDMEPNTVAITSWTRMDKFSVSELERKRVTDFIEAHNKRFNPEGF
jgi:hypothetical protein